MASDETDTKTPTEVVAEQLRKTRGRKGWTQQQLADRLGEIGNPIDRSTIAKIESGARGVTFDEVVAFAVALGVPPYTLAIPRSIDGDIFAELWWKGIEPLGGDDATPEDRRFFNDSCSDLEAAVRREFPGLFEIRWSIEMAIIDAAMLVAWRDGAVDKTAEGKELAAEAVAKLVDHLEDVAKNAEDVAFKAERWGDEASWTAISIAARLARLDPDGFMDVLREAFPDDVIIRAADAATEDRKNQQEQERQRLLELAERGKN